MLQRLQVLEIKSSYYLLLYFSFQLTHYVALIVIFAAIITDQYEEDVLISPVVEVFLNNIYLVPCLLLQDLLSLIRKV